MNLEKLKEHAEAKEKYHNKRANLALIAIVICVILSVVLFITSFVI